VFSNTISMHCFNMILIYLVLYYPQPKCSCKGNNCHCDSTTVGRSENGELKLRTYAEARNVNCDAAGGKATGIASDIVVKCQERAAIVYDVGRQTVQGMQTSEESF